MGSNDKQETQKPAGSGVLEYRVSADAAGQRFDKFVRRLLPDVPVSALYKLIRTKKIRINGARANESQLVSEGDVVTIREAALKAEPRATSRRGPTSVKREFEVLHRDAHLLVCAKPSGLAIHPGSGISGSTLVDQVRAYLADETEEGEFRPAPAHRLDRETSGVVLVARTRQAIVRLSEMFTNDEPKKVYLALVKGRIGRQGVIDTPLAEHQQSAASKAQRGVNLQPALTRWQLVGQTREVSLVEVEIETGRTHQIRRHFASIGHPVVGDSKHGDFPFNRYARAEWGLRRMFLHAARLGINHPITNQPMTFRAPLPPELGAVIDQLEIELPPKFPRR